MIADEKTGREVGSKSPSAPPSAKVPMLTVKPRWSILTTMVLYTALLVTLVVASLGTAQLYDTLAVYEDFGSLQQQSWRTAIRREGLAMAGQLAVTLAPAVAEHNYSLVEEAMDRTARDEAILYAATFDETGATIAHDGIEPSAERVAGIAKSTGKGDSIPIELGGIKALLFSAPLVYAEKGRGSVWLAYSLQELERILARVRRDKNRVTHGAVRRTVMLGVAALAFGLLLSVAQGLRITRPIRHLAEKATKVAAGDLMAKATIKSKDEVGQLGHAFNFMTDRVAALLDETADKVRLENEMEVASAVQERFVASSDLVQTGALQMAGHYQPASFCGGDFWNYFHVGPEKVLLVIGDVTGHGISSALLTATAKSCLDTVRVVWEDQIASVSRLADVLNRVLFEAARGHVTMTCWISVFDLRQREMTFVNAGHPSPFFYRLNAGEYAADILVVLGNRLGELRDTTYAQHSIRLKEGDVFVWYTDGLTEGENHAGREFGTRQAGQVVLQNARRRPDELRDSLMHAANEHYQGHPQADDITLVAARFGAT